MIKLFLVTLLCMAVFAQSEPDTNNDQIWQRFGQPWNTWIEKIRERIKDRMNNLHHEIEQQHPTVEESSPTGTPNPPRATNRTGETNSIEVSTSTETSNFTEPISS